MMLTVLTQSGAYVTEARIFSHRLCSFGSELVLGHQVFLTRLEYRAIEPQGKPE